MAALPRPFKPGEWWHNLNELIFPLWLRLIIDGLAFAGIGWFAWQHGGFLLRNDLFLYGDHPGQFYRLWQLVAVIWPEEGRLIGWSPYWYGGYPELQFYPPGFALAGWLLWQASFQQLPLFGVYQTLVFASYVLPAVGFYVLLAWGLHDRLAGMSAAWFSMTAPVALGGALGVMIGLLGERLAFGLMPLLILAGLWLMRSARKGWPWGLAGLILAGIFLLHPYQALLPLTILGIYALSDRNAWRAHLAWLGWVLMLGLGLTAFWWLPLGLRRHFFIPLIEAPWLEIMANLDHLLWFRGVGWLLLAGIVGSLFQPKARRWLTWAILLAGLGLLAFIYVDYHVLVERLNFYALDPVRLIAGVTFSLFVGLALGVSELAWMGIRLLRGRRWGVYTLPLLLIVPWLLYQLVLADYNFAKWIGKWQPQARQTPIFLSQAAAKYDFDAFWQRLADTPGRVLFTSHYTLLFDVPTSLKAGTPYLAGREILGGTFTHRTPVGSYLWLGRTRPPVLRGKVEHQDDKSLAGVAWENMSDDFFFELTRRFNASLVVATAADPRALAFLANSSRFEQVWTNRLFTFYKPVGYEPVWAEADGAAAKVTRYERTAIDVTIGQARPGATLLVKVANYDLWSAEANGQLVPIQTDAYGLMQLALPPGSYSLRLRYQPGWPEQVGAGLSLGTLLAVAGLLIWRYFGHIKQAVIGRGGL